MQLSWVTGAPRFTWIHFFGGYETRLVLVGLISFKPQLSARGVPKIITFLRFQAVAGWREEALLLLQGCKKL